MAEQRRFQQLRWHGTGVDWNEWPVAAGRVGVNRLRDEFLPRTALALNENGGTARSNLGDQVEEAEHRLALADDIFEVVALLQGALKLNDLFFRTVPRNGGANVSEKFFVVPRLLDEVLSPGTNGVHDVA